MNIYTKLNFPICENLYKPLTERNDILSHILIQSRQLEYIYTSIYFPPNSISLIRFIAIGSLPWIALKIMSSNRRRICLEECFTMKIGSTLKENAK